MPSARKLALRQARDVLNAPSGFESDVWIEWIVYMTKNERARAEYELDTYALAIREAFLND